MAEVTKEKILKINTQGAEKNVKSLKTQIRELKEQLAQLDKGTEEYNRVAKQLADTNQKQIEINEAMKYSNKDLGATLSNLTRVSAGVMGAINGVNAAMQLMGIEGEDAEKAMKNIQATMAIIQGLSAIDTAVKSITGLSNAFTKLGQAKVFAAGNTATSVAAEMAETGAMGSNTLATIDNNKEAVKYTKQQYDNAEATDASTLAIATETAALQGHKVELERNTGAMRTAEGQLQRIELAYQQGFITEEQYIAMKERANKIIDYSKKKIEEETLAINENTISKNANSTSNIPATKTTNELGDSLDKTAKTAKSASKAFIGWTIAIVAAVYAIAKLVKMLSHTKHSLEGLNAEFAKIDVAASRSTAETIGKFEILRRKFIDAKASGEKMTKWVKDHTKELKELNIENTSLNNLENIFINQTDEYITALSRRWDAENKMKVMQEEYIENLKKQQEYTKLNEKYNINWNNPKNVPNLSDEYTLEIDGQEVTKTLEEWKDASFDAWMANRRILEEFGDLAKELTDAENGLKKFGTTFTVTTTSTSRTLKEMIGDIRTLYKETLNQMVTLANTKGIFNGAYDELDSFRNKVYQLVAGSEGTRIGTMFTEEFVNSIKNGLDGLGRYSFSLSNIFDMEGISELAKQLTAEEELLGRYLRGELEVTEDVIKKQKEKVQALKEEVTTINDIANSVLEYTKALDKQAAKEREIKNWNRDFEQTKRLYEEYRADVRSNNPFKEVNKSIAEATYSLQNLKDELNALNEEEKKLQGGQQTKEVVTRLEEIAKRRRELALEQFNLENDLEEAMYQKRLIDIQQLMDEQEKNAAQQNWENEEYELDWGNGADTYNTQLQALEVQLQMLENQKAAVEQYYTDLMATVEEFSEQWVLLEQEKNAAIEELDRQHTETEVQIAQESSRRRLQIFKAYVNAYQSISSQIGSILSAEMDRYDSNTEEYKRLKYRQGVITTTEGVLSAFMSGIESGVPAPWNLIVAAAMAATTLAAGIMQLNNIKNEKVGGTMPDTVDLSSREYDTLSYAQGADTLSAIQDQRVWVAESDITSTQNRVQVAESQATF